ncbi:MAG: glycosyltransferase family 4 protein [Anaerolineae bacterium]|nr:glycosyltransferase family 4 protein [Anaerolineae bacterium]MDQ7037260.1 glycosyltransferase family 4 protein [Anaerolineae bacterium]
MNIGFISFRLAGVDGVSLETFKLADVFEEMGHQCFYCGGELDEKAQAGMLVPEMHFTDSVAQEHHDEAFSNPKPEPKFFQEVYHTAENLRRAVEQFIRDYKIDVLVPQNVLAIPMNIALSIGIANAIRRTRVKTLAHHHDFYWERERFLANGIQDILNEAFPPKLQPVVHMVINKAMQQRLNAFRGIEALYLPNVFDFENPPPAPDDYTKTFRSEIGLSDDDLIILQPTRIVRRKGIEHAIELMRKLNDERLVFVITGYEGDEKGGYGTGLREQADRAGIRYKFIGDYVGSERGEINGHKVYELWDIYPHAHLITYPSIYEGFGNALIETLYFRKPLVVNTYPMYLTDIKPTGVKAVEFSYDITDEVVAKTRQLIDDASLRDDMTEHNYQVGLEHFSYKILRKVLQHALQKLDSR